LTGCDYDFARLVWLSRGKFFLLRSSVKKVSLPAFEKNSCLLAENVNETRA